MYPVAPVRKIRIAAVYHSALVPRETLIDFFRDLSLARGDFLVHDDGFRSRSYTYREVGRAARGFAAHLHEIGLRKGDKVIFWSENRPEWIVAFWGCLLSGVIVVPIDYRASPDFLARVAKIVAAKIVLVGIDVIAAPDANVQVKRLESFKWKSAEFVAAEITRDDIAEIIFT